MSEPNKSSFGASGASDWRDEAPTQLPTMAAGSNLPRPRRQRSWSQILIGVLFLAVGIGIAISVYTTNTQELRTLEELTPIATTASLKEGQEVLVRGHPSNW